MTLWILAVVLLGVLGLVGYYQGSVRAAFSLIGLFIATLLCIPLGGAFKPLLPIFGIKHPVLHALIGPVLAFIIIMALVKSGAFFVHKKVETWFKYRASDTLRLMWERLSARLGIGLGMANGAIYFVLICVVIYVVGYFTLQIGTSDKDSWQIKAANVLARDLESTGLDKAVAPFVPLPEKFMNGVDVVADIHRNPLLQRRLSTYPPFLPLAERPEFQQIAQDRDFQKFWLESKPSFSEFVNHDRVRPLARNADFYQEIKGLVGADLDDLRTYLRTGESPKYSSESILGRWDFSLSDSMGRFIRANPTISRPDRAKLRGMLNLLNDGVLTAALNGKASLKVGSANKIALTGTWKNLGGFEYTLELKGADMRIRGNGMVQGDKFLMQWPLPATIANTLPPVLRNPLPLVFEK